MRGLGRGDHGRAASSLPFCAHSALSGQWRQTGCYGVVMKGGRSNQLCLRLLGPSPTEHESYIIHMTLHPITGLSDDACMYSARPLRPIIGGRGHVIEVRDVTNEGLAQTTETAANEEQCFFLLLF